MHFAKTVTRPVLGLTLALTGSVLAQPKVHPDELKLKPKTDAAIEKGVQYLIGDQLRDGTWGRYGNYDGGKTALCLYALLKCGVAYDHPTVRRALLYIDRIQPEQTYTVACMMLAYAATGQPRYDERLRELAKLIVSWQRGGDFGYPHRHGTNVGWSRPDLSNTQYAALGLWVAQKHKIPIPSAVWRRLISATMRYQSRAEKITLKRTGKHTTSAGKTEIRGFGYGLRGKATGSMTTAGSSILQICKIGLGERLGSGERRRLDNAIEKGIAWLGHHFSVAKNPGHGGWTYYYLYGLERVGSLTRLEKIGNHWWYLRGARQILGWQNKNGSWTKGSGGQAQVKTAFALLFLRRATARAAITGGSNKGSSKKRNLFAAGGPKNPASIGGAGQQPLSLWIKGFGTEVMKRHKPNGLRVIQVEYLDGKRVLGQLAGDPLKPWVIREAFLHRANALQRGKHEIKARITLVKADTPRGETTPTEIIESPVMKVEIRDIFAKWMEVAASLTRDNQLTKTPRKATASSDSKGAMRAFDGNDATHWVCTNKDKAPELTVTTERIVVARELILTQAGTRIRDLGHFDRIKTIDVFINRSREPIRVELDPDQLAVTVFKFERTRRIRTLKIRIVDRERGRQRGRAGFSEIVLSR